MSNGSESGKKEGNTIWRLHCDAKQGRYALTVAFRSIQGQGVLHEARHRALLEKANPWRLSDDGIIHYTEERLGTQWDEVREKQASSEIHDTRDEINTVTQTVDEPPNEYEEEN